MNNTYDSVLDDIRKAEKNIIRHVGFKDMNSSFDGDGKLSELFIDVTSQENSKLITKWMSSGAVWLLYLKLARSAMGLGNTELAKNIITFTMLMMMDVYFNIDHKGGN